MLKFSMNKSAGKIIISDIKVEKTDYISTYLVGISTDGRPGNAYFSDEELAFSLSVKKNDTMTVHGDTCDITYEVRDDENVVVWSEKEENVNIRQTYNTKVVPKDLDYGVYHFYVKAENKENNYKSIYSTYFSYSVAARKNPRFGVKTHYGHQYPNPEKAVYLMEKSGVGFSNGGWGWAGVEQTIGSYSYGTGPVSKFQELMSESPVDLMHSASYGNILYTGAPTATYMPVTPEAREGFANAALWSVKAHKNEYIEVWNEPDMTNFNPGHATWAEYTELLKETYKKIKEYDENIKVIGGSLVAIPLLSEEKLKGIIDAGGGEYMDALSIHPYIWESSPINDNFRIKIPYVQDMLAKMGYPDMEIWITELGWGAGPGQKFTYEQQAAYLVQCYLMSVSNKNFGKFMWYDFQNDGIIETDREDMFGMVTHWNDKEPWAARKSFVASAYMNDLMSGAEYVEDSDDGKNGYLYHFTNDGKDIYALFSSKEAYLSGLKSNKEQLKVVDMYGNEDEYFTLDGVLNVLGGEEVTYIIGENLELEFAEPTVNFSDIEIDALFGEGEKLQVLADKAVSIECTTTNENVKIEKNENSAKISFEEYSANTEKVFVTVKNGDKKLLSGKVLVNCTRPISASIRNDLFSTKNFNRWRGYLTITNNSETHNSPKGKMTFTSPDRFSKKLPPVQIPELKPGQTKEIKFHFPEILIKEAYDINAVITLDNGYVAQIAERIDFAVAPYASEKPTIDGVLEENEWIMGAALDFSREEQAMFSNGFTWGGKSDLSGRVCFEYDEKYLYLGAVVEDDVFYQPNTDTTIWKGDSIQFAVGYLRANGNKDSTSFTEVGIALTPNDEIVCVYQTEDVSTQRGILDLKALGIECEITREKTSTVYELKMPWTSLVPQGSEFTGGKNIAFSMLVNDNDGLGRKGWLEYASGVGYSKNINLFTFLKLMDK